MAVTLCVLRADTERELKPFPAANGGFQELQEERFFTPASGAWSLRIDDEPLVAQQDGTWRWKPGFFAGPVIAELSGPDGESRWLLDVSPDPAKLGRERFDAMLSELIDDEPALVFGQEASMLSMMHGDIEPGGDLGVLVALSRLKTWGEALIRAVHVIERQPRQTLLRRRHLLSAHRVRSLDVAGLRRLVRSRHVQRSEPGSGRMFAIDRNAEVEVSLVESTVDSPANRIVVELLKRVVRRIAATSEALALAVESAREPVKAARAARLPARRAFLATLEQRLRQRLRAEPWRQVSEAAASSAGMNALSSDPAYARLGALAWAILRTGIGGGASDERMWLSPTWEIFERWCFVRVAQQLKNCWPELVWSRTRAPQSATAERIGRGAGVELRLLLQPRFPAWDQSEKREFRSLSREREPDLVIAVKTPQREVWMVLDAKYRVRRPRVLEAMEAAHIYRDSLRWNGAPPLLSLLLVPATPETPWLRDEVFQHQHRVGVSVFDGELPPLVLSELKNAFAAG